MAVKDAGKLFVCRTCVRDQRLAPGEPTEGSKLYDALAAALTKAGGDVVVRGTACLNGCLHPCNASVRGHGKALLRFSRLTPEDAPALIQMARLYLKHKTGELADKELPESLRAKLTARAPALNPGR